MANSDLVQSLLRGLDLLKLISTHQDGLRLNEIAQLTGMKKTTLHNLLRTLIAKNFAVKTNADRFRIGPELLDIAAAVRVSNRQNRIAEKLREVAEAFPDCIITLSTINTGTISCVFRISPDLPGVLQRPEQYNFMPYTSASAIVLQAVNPHKAQQLERDYPFEEYGIGMWGNIENFRNTACDVSRNGYYCRSGEFFLFASAMPEGYAIGFKAPGNRKNDIKTFLTATEKFRAGVWDNLI